MRGAPVDPRSQERRRQEDTGDDTPIRAGNRPDVVGPGVLGEEAIEERAELARLLTGLRYPARKEAVVEVAHNNGASEEAMEHLAGLPEGEFDLFEAIWEALGGQPD